MQGKDAAGAHYVLVGAVVHIGHSLATGHYVSYSARSPAMSSTNSSSTTASRSSKSSGSSGTMNAGAANETAGKEEGASGGGGKSSGGADASSSEDAAAFAPPSGAFGAANGGGSGLPANGGADHEEGPSEKEGDAPWPLPRRPELRSDLLRWFYASDSRVSPATWEQVAACEAYILIYSRVR